NLEWPFESQIPNSKFLTLQRSIHAAGARAARVAARAACAGAAGGAHRPVRERLRRGARLRREDRHQLLEILARARRTRRRLALAGQELEALMAAAAFVFKKRPGVF